MAYNRASSVSQKGIPGKRNSAGVGYIVIPPDTNAEDYKKTCLQKGKVSLMCEFERIDNVRIAKHIIADLVFPEEQKDSEIRKVGSAIIWVNIPKYNQPVAVGVLTKENELVSFNENEFSLKKNTKNSRVEIIGNSNQGTLSINVEAKSSLNNKFQINVLNKNNKATLGVNVNGNIDIESNTAKIKILSDFLLLIKNDLEDDKESSISFSKSEGFKYSDLFGSEITIDKDGKIGIKPKATFEIGTNPEPLPKGDSLNDNLKKMMDVLSKITTAVQTYSNAQTVVCGSAPFTPLLPALQAMSASLTSALSEFSSIIAGFDSHLSDISKSE